MSEHPSTRKGGMYVLEVQWHPLESALAHEPITGSTWYAMTWAELLRWLPSMRWLWSAGNHKVYVRPAIKSDLRFKGTA